ncbi:hypothetical protein COCOBI_19-1410 [Coccomyxa sp. Obi]|nr:hypothetical protein COCOBI_19-1410 [Coccomyxa sp. Obi]
MEVGTARGTPKRQSGQQNKATPQRQVESLPTGSCGAQRDGEGPAEPDVGLQGASGMAPSHSGEEQPTVDSSISEEQPNVDSNTREQGSASCEGQPPVQLPEPPPSRRITRSTSRTTQPSTAGPVSSGEPTRPPSSTQARSEGTQSDAAKVQPRRRLPEPDLDAIEDPQERQRQHRLARIRASAAVAREKKRQEMLDMSARAEALEQENVRLRMLLSQRDQETLRLRQELIRVQGHAPPPLLSPAQGGALLSDLAAMSSEAFHSLRGGATTSGLLAPMPPFFPAGGFAPGQAISAMPQEPSSYLMAAPRGSGDAPQYASPEGSLGRQQQHLPPQWPAVASGQASRLSQAAFSPPLPDPAPGYAGPPPFLGGSMGPVLVTPGAAAPGFAGPSFAGPDFPVPAPLGLAPLGQPSSPVRQPGSPIGQPSQPVLGPSGFTHITTAPSGVIYGVDGQWIRLRPGVNPAPPHPPLPAGRGRGRGSPPL